MVETKKGTFDSLYSLSLLDTSIANELSFFHVLNFYKVKNKWWFFAAPNTIKSWSKRHWLHTNKKKPQANCSRYREQEPNNMKTCKREDKMKL